MRVCRDQSGGISFELPVIRAGECRPVTRMKSGKGWSGRLYGSPRARRGFPEGRNWPWAARPEPWSGIET